MNKGTITFGITLGVFWATIILSTFFPIKDSETNLAILAMLGFVLAVILGMLADKNKLF